MANFPDLMWDENQEKLYEMSGRVDAIQWHISLMVQSAISNPNVRDYVKSSFTMLSETLKERVKDLGDEDGTSSEGHSEWEHQSDVNSEEEYEWEDI